MTIRLTTAQSTNNRILPALVGLRLTRITGAQWLAGIIAGAVFSLWHLPNWGVGPVLSYFVAVGLAMSFFAWRRDLLANIVAHTIVDGMGLVVIPALAGVR